MDLEFNYIEPKNQIKLSLEEFKGLKNESVIIKSLPEWLSVNKECSVVEERRVINSNKISPKKLNLPWFWNESNYGKYWIAYKEN